MLSSRLHCSHIKKVFVSSVIVSAKHVDSRFDCLQDGTPLQFYMHGIDLYMNSHFDDWIVDIDSWRPGPIDEGEWRVPSFCNQPGQAEEEEELQRHHVDGSLVMEVARQLPNPHFGTLSHLL